MTRLQMMLCLTRMHTVQSLMRMQMVLSLMEDADSAEFNEVADSPKFDKDEPDSVELNIKQEDGKDLEVDNGDPTMQKMKTLKQITLMIMVKMTV